MKKSNASQSGPEKIASSLAEMAVPIESLLPDPENARLHPEKNLEALRRSLAKFGQLKPIVVRKATGVVVAGNGTLKAAKQLGWLKIAAVVEDMSSLDAVGYGLADNRTAELAEWDEQAVAKLDKLLQAGGEGAIGWTAKELETLRMKLGDEQGEGLAQPIEDDAIVEAAFKHFRKTGFPYPNLPLHVSMQAINQLAAAKPDVLNKTTTGIDVCNSFHPHRYHATAGGMKSPFQTFSDDKTFKGALAKTLKLDGKIGDDFVGALRYYNGTHACSNFRPGFALLMYRRFCPGGGTILDTSTGYGGRLVGFLASSASRYIGIDPAKKTHEGNARMAKELGFKDRVLLLNLPAEDVHPLEFACQCDLAFTSPPYFSKERYSEEATQSWKRWPSGDAWRAGFLAPMLSLQWCSLKKGGRAIINIADVNINGKKVPLVAWTIDAAIKAGFKHERTESYPLKTRLGTGWSEEPQLAEEPCLIFRKERR